MSCYMKTRNLFGILLLFLYIVSFFSCNNDEIEEKKIIDYREYVLTVASEKLPGIVTSCGSSHLTEVYAVKKGDSKEWEALLAVAGFEYKPGYEYKIRISETSYLDYNMGEPAWTEYELLEIISKEEKSSENLPRHFIPDWYYEKYCAYIDTEFQYAIDADQKEYIENDLKTNEALSQKGLRCYITTGFKNWILLDVEKYIVKQSGILRTERKDYKEFPETYKLLLPKGNILGYMQWNFIKDIDSEENVAQYDVLIYSNTTTKSFAPESVQLWLYKDLTTYYQSKYPEANVRAVVICYKVNI